MRRCWPIPACGTAESLGRWRCSGGLYRRAVGGGDVGRVKDGTG
ncbi:MAG: hypothetical protein VX294_09940 [Candidatus Latescibacterota bacterium]|nr:hypothetical protein [Candidatus Latescibacterota bacterium]